MTSLIGLDKFKEIEPEMLWKGSALDQIKHFEEMVVNLSKQIRLEARVSGSHTSKSIHLPVISITTNAGEFTLRDNFYDVNLMAVLHSPTVMPLDEFFAGIQDPVSWTWYLEQIERARGYSWREWTDDEMEDPRILRVKDKRPGVNMWWDKKAEEKDRWANRMTNPVWYTRDWSSGEVSWDGEFGPGAELFIQRHAFAQGIDVKTTNRKYQRGIKDFIIATGTLLSVSIMIERLTKRSL